MTISVMGLLPGGGSGVEVVDAPGAALAVEAGGFDAVLAALLPVAVVPVAVVPAATVVALPDGPVAAPVARDHGDAADAGIPPEESPDAGAIGTPVLVAVPFDTRPAVLPDASAGHQPGTQEATPAPSPGTREPVFDRFAGAAPAPLPDVAAPAAYGPDRGARWAVLRRAARPLPPEPPVMEPPVNLVPGVAGRPAPVAASIRPIAAGADALPAAERAAPALAGPVRPTSAGGAPSGVRLPTPEAPVAPVAAGARGGGAGCFPTMNEPPTTDLLETAQAMPQAGVMATEVIRDAAPAPLPLALPAAPRSVAAPPTPVLPTALPAPSAVPPAAIVPVAAVAPPRHRAADMVPPADDRVRAAAAAASPASVSTAPATAPVQAPDVPGVATAGDRLVATALVVPALVVPPLRAAAPMAIALPANPGSAPPKSPEIPRNPPSPPARSPSMPLSMPFLRRESPKFAPDPQPVPAPFNPVVAAPVASEPVATLPVAAAVPPEPALDLAIASARLGPVRIAVEGGSGDLRVALNVSPAAAVQLNADAPRLVADLAAQGVRLATLDIAGNTHSAMQQSLQHQGDSRNRHAPPPPLPLLTEPAAAAPRATASPRSDRYA